MTSTPAAPATDTVLCPVLDVVLGAAAELGGVEWDQIETCDLPTAAAGLARARSQVDAALLAVAGRLVETDAAAEHGWASAKDFLTHLTGGRKGAGGTLLRIAGHTADLPEVRDALATGTVSTAQAGVIGARVATLPHDDQLRAAAAARMLALVTDHGYDATDLDRGFPALIRALDPDGTLLGTDQTREKQERGAHHARFLSFSPDTLGGVRIKGYATLEEAEHVRATLHPLAAPATTEPGACGGDPLNPDRPLRDTEGRRTGRSCPDPTCSHDGRDPRESGTRLWDALIEACDRLQATETLPTTHGTTARLTVTLDHDTLTGRLAGEGLLGSGETLSAAAVRRLACDAEIIPAVLGSHSQVLDLGRTQRLVTTGIWHALVLRDQHCAFPGCTRLPIACDAHHITHWADGGPTNLDNLVLLCRRHHTLTHHTPWQIHLDPTTRRPVWTPPPPVDDRARFTHHPPTRPPPLAA